MTDDEFIAQLSQHERLLHSISVTFARGDAEEEKDIYQEISTTCGAPATATTGSAR